MGRSLQGAAPDDQGLLQQRVIDRRRTRAGNRRGGREEGGTEKAEGKLKETR